MEDSAYGRSRAELLLFADRLGTLAPDRAEDIQAATLSLKNNRFEVAVIGQIKAGKSSFLNAFCERPGLLPTDVNPWTAVICRLFFGEGGKPEHSGIFRFFSREQWAEITEGRPMKSGSSSVGKPGTDHADGNLFGRLAKEAAKRVRAVAKGWNTESGEASDGPAVTAAEKKNSQVERDRRLILDRTRRRLGVGFEKLLGTERQIADVTPDVLTQYLCVGDEHTQDQGKYSDITREAELYLPLAPFPDPCTIVDTPGTNDPFRARSKVTLEYLKHSDAYLLVMSANQALSAQDADLLETLLCGLHKERLLVFINRLDQLNDIHADGSKVRARVEALLQHDYPAARIQVRMGSARWAELANSEDLGPAALNKFLSADGVRPFGIANDWFSGSDFDTWQASPLEHLAEIREAMKKASGLPAAHQAVEQILLREKGKAILESARANLRSQAEAYALERGARAKAAQVEADVMEGGAKSVAAELKVLEEQMQGLQLWQGRVATYLETAKTDLQESLDGHVKPLRDRLQDVATSAAQAAAKALKKNGTSVWDHQQWTIDVRVTRKELEIVFQREYERARIGLAADQERSRKAVRRLFEENGELAAVEIDAIRVADVDPSPALNALADECSVDLGGWWDRIWAGDEDTGMHAEELKAHLLAALLPVVEGLAQSAAEAMRESIEYDVTANSAALARAKTKVAAQLEKRQTSYKQTLTELDPERTRLKASERREQAKAHEERAAELTALASKVAQFVVPAETTVPM